MSRHPHTSARLHVVTGKGGTGKTTVSAALALTLASRGKRVLVAEVEGRGGIATTFDVPPLSTDEKQLLKVGGGGSVWGLAVDAKAALLEYLSMFYRLGRAGGALEKMGAIDFATTIAPGVRDVLSIGKVYEAVRRTERGRPVYDAVVLDAPPTGRVVRFLNVNHEVADLAKVGPIRNQADSITRLLRSSECAVHIVTLLEEMPVQETLDAVTELREARLPVGAIVVNQAGGEALSPATLDELARGGPDRAGLSAALGRQGLPGDDATAEALVAAANDHRRRIEAEDSLVAELEATGLPMYVLPHLFDPSGAGDVRELASALAGQEDWA